MAKNLTLLTDLGTKEVSLVRRGANRKKRFPVFKSEEDMDEQMHDILEAVIETEAEGEDALIEAFEKQKISDRAMSAAKGALRILNAFKDEPGMKDAVTRLVELAGYPAPKAKAKDEDPCPKPKGADLSAKQKKQEEGDEGDGKRVKKSHEPGSAAGLDALPEEIRGQVETVFKAQDEQIQKALDRAEEAEKILKAERDERQRQEFVAKAKDDLSHFPGASAEELGVMLKGLHDVNPELAEQQMQRMKAASEALKKSEVLGEVGKAGPDDTSGSAWDRVQKAAAGIVEKSDVLMTKEKAIAHILKSNPKLYQEYLDEHPAQIQPGM